MSEERLKREQDNLKSVQQEIEDINKEIISLVEMRKKKLKEKKKPIEEVLSKALKEVFEDEWKMKIATSEKEDSISYNFSLSKNGIEYSNEEIIDGHGGGIVVFISTMLRVLAGKASQAANLYFLDETLSGITREYLFNAVSYIKKFSQENNLNLTLVGANLNKAHFGLADTVHMIKDGKAKESQGNTTIKIENFQSIEEVTLSLDGLTIISGKTGAGKSAVGRAISSVCYNRFNDNWRKDKTKPTRITLTSTDYSISFERNSSASRWIANGHDILTGDQKNIGNMPDEISDYLKSVGFIAFSNNKNGYAYAPQHASTWLLTNSSGIIEKFFVKLFDIENEDREILQKKAILKAKEKMIEDINKRILNLEMTIRATKINHIKYACKIIMDKAADIDIMGIEKEKTDLKRLVNDSISMVAKRKALDFATLIAEKMLANNKNREALGGLEKKSALLKVSEYIKAKESLDNERVDIEMLKKIIKIKECGNLSLALKEAMTALDASIERLHRLHEDYGMEECEECQGIGLVKKRTTKEIKR